MRGALIVLGVGAATLVWTRYRKRKRRGARGQAPLKVLVTGGSSGIGAALVAEFEARGDQVVSASRSGGGGGVVMDVRDAQQVERGVREAKERLGGLELVVLNAGVTQSPLGHLVDTEMSEVERVILTNLVGSLCVAREAARSMEAGGNIVFMGGAGTQGMKTVRFLSYGASKAGFAQIVKTLHAELKEKDIGVHLMTPGMVITPLLMGYGEAKDPKTLKIFNILAEMPETVGQWAVPILRDLDSSTSESHAYLTAKGAAWRFLRSFFVSQTNRLVQED